MPSSDGGSTELFVGARVRVLPGRQFPAFVAGDAGEVRRIDAEARTCDVRFDSRPGEAVTVALRHLCMEGLDAGIVTPIAATLAGEELMRRGRIGVDQSVTAEDALLGRSPIRSRSSTPIGGRQKVFVRQLDVGVADTSGVDMSHTARSRLSPTRSPLYRISPRDFRAVDGCSETFDFRDSATRVSPSGRGLDADMSSRLSALEVFASSQQKTLAALEARLASCEASLQTGHGAGDVSPSAVGSEPARRLVAARVAALEGAHQAEVADLRRALDDAMALSRQHEQHQRKQHAAAKDAEQAALAGEKRVLALRELARTVEMDLSALTEKLEAHERRASNIGDVVASAEDGLARLSSLLESKERRTVELGQSVRASDEGVVGIKSALDDQVGRLRELELRVEAARVPDDAPRGVDTEPIWQALRELQELVVNESEHRAAGLREVLGVVSQSVEQLRNEQARQAGDFEDRARSDSRRVNKRVVEAQSKTAEYEKRADALDQRLDALSQSLAAERCARAEVVAWIEEQFRGSTRTQPQPQQAPAAAQREPSPAVLGTSNSRSLLLTAGGSPDKLPTSAITSSSMQRLEALEARFNQGANGVTAMNDKLLGSHGSRGFVESREDAAAFGTIGRLRGQLQALRSEVNGLSSGNMSPQFPDPRELGASVEPVYSTRAGTFVASGSVPGHVSPDVSSREFNALGESSYRSACSYGSAYAGSARTSLTAAVPAKVVRCYSAPSVRAPRPSAPAEPVAGTRPLSPGRLIQAQPLSPGRAVPVVRTVHSVSTAATLPSSAVSHKSQARVVSAPFHSSAATATVQENGMDLFAALDKNGDGVLTREEFAAARLSVPVLAPSAGSSPTLASARTVHSDVPGTSAVGPRVSVRSAGSSGWPSATSGPGACSDPSLPPSWGTAPATGIAGSGACGAGGVAGAPPAATAV
eukprot:TRINITY_DN16121_c0_g3_i1.p1 TRINITY_DN16121_c0_g3~~TRINITY_DN16121_c0_g3_i1.p1  ORF type:complete len:934 (-),score=151.47 TRINITY_DN16121_c0_g3_i1:27-2828(-)